MINTLPNLFGSVLGPRARSQGSSRIDDTVDSLKARVPALLAGTAGALAVLALVASFQAQSEVHRQLFLASTIVFLALGVGAFGADPIRITMTQIHDQPLRTNTESMRAKPGHGPSYLASVASESKAESGAPSNHTLVDGSFGGADARTLLMPLLDSEVNFFKLKCLSSQVRCDEPDPAALECIASLDAAREDARQLIEKATAAGLRVRVRSTLDLSIEPESASDEWSAA